MLRLQTWKPCQTTLSPQKPSCWNMGTRATWASCEIMAERRSKLHAYVTVKLRMEEKTSAHESVQWAMNRQWKDLCYKYHHPDLLDTNRAMLKTRGTEFSTTPMLHSAVITTIWINGKQSWNHWRKLWNLAQMTTWSTRLTSPKHFLDIPRCCLWCWYGQILGYQEPVRRWQNRALHTVRRKTRKTGNTANQGHSQIKQAERIPYPDNAKHDGKAHGADSG